jgi:hypothetical protein
MRSRACTVAIRRIAMWRAHPVLLRRPEAHESSHESVLSLFQYGFPQGWK